MNHSLLKRCLAELIGTFVLVFFGCATITTIGKGPLSEIIAAFTFASSIISMIYALGPVSGGHFNPAVTLGFTITKRFSISELIPYWISQCLGSIVAIALLKDIFTNKFVEVNYGATMVSNKIPLGSGFQIEMILTAILLIVVLAVSANPKTSQVIVGLAPAFTILMGALAFSSITGASMNPARSLGPALFAGKEALSTLWLYISAQLIGGIIGAGIYEAIREKNN